MADKLTTVTVRVPSDLYLEYKMVLLQEQKDGQGRKTTTQDLLAHIKSVVDASKAKRK
jgi:hypothetical protein